MEPAAQAHDKARRGFLEEGARSYLKAANAVMEFEREVQERCRKVMERHISDYGLALKVDLKSSEIQNLIWPEKWEGTWASVGVRVLRRDIPGITWWEGYCTLEWGSDDEFSCYVGEWFPTRKMAMDLFQKFGRVDPDKSVTASDKNVGIAQTLKPEEAPDFEEHMDDLLMKWIKLWKKIGGINAVSKG